MQSLGNMTRAVDLLFRIVDSPMREKYHTAWKKLCPAVRVSTTEEELFTLRAVLVNVLTKAHIDCNDQENGWAWIGVLGDFNDGDLYMPQLGIQVPMPAGSITGMRGRGFAALYHQMERQTALFRRPLFMGLNPASRGNG
jgi:hypothetical protein